MENIFKVIRNEKYLEFKTFYFLVTGRICDSVEMRKISKENIVKLRDKDKKTIVRTYVNKNGIIEWISHRVFLKNKKKIIKELIEAGFIGKNDLILSTGKGVTFGDNLEIILNSLGIELDREVSVCDYVVDYFIKSKNIAIEYNEKGHQSYNKEKENERMKKLSSVFDDVIILKDDKSDVENIAEVLKRIFKWKQKLY